MNNPDFYVKYTSKGNLTPALTEKYKSIIEKHVSLDGKNILDIGCGDGRLAIYLSEFANSWNGIDINPYAIKVARENIENLSLEDKVTFESGSFLDIPFDKKFDIIISSNSLHFEDNKSEAFENMDRFLNDEGYVIFFEPTPSANGWRSNELNEDSKEFDESVFRRKVERLNKSYNAIRTQDLFELVDEYMPSSVSNNEGKQYHAILRKVK